MPKYSTEVPEKADDILMHSVLQRVATGPELSKNISYEEARSVTNALLEGSPDPVRSAIYLIGLRMKRETDDELKGILDSLRAYTEQTTAEADDVVVISDPYNGFNRTLHASLFVLPVLAACGVKAYSHGVEMMGPKFGVTHHAIIKALGGDPLRSTQSVTDQINDRSVGWGYADQSVFCKELHSLSKLRTQIVKRTAINTAEVMLTPIRGQSKTHLVTGYVHKPYRETYAMLGRHMSHDSLLLIRGTEGGVIPSFRAKAHFVRYSGKEAETEHDVELEPLGLARDYRAEDIPENMLAATPDPDTIGMKWDIDALAKLCADKGVCALEGEPGAVQDAAVLGSALIMWHIGAKASMEDATNSAREAINSGAALRHLRSGLQ